MNPLRAAAVIAVVLATAPLCSGAGDATLLDETGSGVVPVNAEAVIRVRGVQGQIWVRGGAAGELEFRSTSPKTEGAEVPVAVWTDGETFRLEPPKGGATVETNLTVSVPPGMRVRLELERATVNVMSLDGELAIYGRMLKVEAQTLLRSLHCEIEGGAVSVHGAARGVTIRGGDLAVVVENTSGRVDLRLKGGTAKLSGLMSGLQGDFTGTGVAVDTVADTVSLRFAKGRAELARIRDGGEVVLTGCAVGLSQIGGTFTVTSDSAVRFNDCKASLHIENSAGPVIGVKSDGMLEVTTYNAQVALREIQGQLRVTGDGLEVKLEQIGATVAVSTSSSSVALDFATGPVTVETDGGDVTVSRADAQVDLKTRGGNVRVVHLKGPITVQADGPLVDVGWDVLTSAADSKIINEGGDVTVRFPPAGDSRVEATSKIARIESSLEKVLVLENGESAQGVVGGGGHDLRTILIKASGEVKLVGPDAQEPSEEAP